MSPRALHEKDARKKRILFTFFSFCVSGLLRGAAVAHRAGHDDADDSAGTDVGPEGHLHPGILSERRRPGKGPHERGRGLFRSGRQELL